jgi:tetratricopeptide (TPR) repeat protein
VRSHDPPTLVSNLAALAGADALDLPEREEPRDEVKFEAALRWLEAHPTWLMILDNVDDEKAVAAVGKLMARLKGGHVIVTARASNLPPSLRKLELVVLDEDAATEFLLVRTRDDRPLAADDPDKARELARELDGLALGLEQAGAHIATERISFARYLTLWRESREKVVGWLGPTLTSYDKSLATTWSTSVDRLSPESRRLLDRLAMLASDPIPDSLIDVAVPDGVADYDAYRVRAGLYAYSLITRATGDDGSAKGFVIHRLVQDFARRTMTEERRSEVLREALGWIDDAFVSDPQDVRSWPVLDPLAPHALAVTRQADEAGIAEPTGALFNYLGTLFSERARYVEAEQLYRRALAIAEATQGPDHPTVASRLNNLAILLRATDRAVEAEALLRRALAIKERSLGPDHPDVAVLLNTLALLLKDTDRVGDAEPLYRRALTVFESLGPDHSLVATGLNNLAELLRIAKRLVEAEPLFRRALKIYEASYGPDHPNVAANLNNLALLLGETNRPTEAEQLFRRALAIYEASLGPDHPNVARALTNLAELLETSDRREQAEPLYRRALAIDEETLGTGHPQVATGLCHLADVLLTTNRPVEAEPLFRRALKICEARYGLDQPELVTSLGGLSASLPFTTGLGETEPVVRRVLAILEKSSGVNHQSTVLMRKYLAALEASRGRGTKR